MQEQLHAHPRSTQTHSGPLMPLATRYIPHKTRLIVVESLTVEILASGETENAVGIYMEQGDDTGVEGKSFTTNTSTYAALYFSPSSRRLPTIATAAAGLRRRPVGS